jgi:hypothetical protein
VAGWLRGVRIRKNFPTREEAIGTLFIQSELRSEIPRKSCHGSEQETPT